MRYIEAKKQSVINEDNIGFIAKMRSMLPSYIAYSNEKYLRYERRDTSLLQNLLPSVVLELPITFVLYLMLRGVFYLLFNKEISVKFRLFSFWAFFGSMVLSDNIQLFSFLAFSNFYYLHS